MIAIILWSYFYSLIKEARQNAEFVVDGYDRTDMDQGYKLLELVIG